MGKFDVPNSWMRPGCDLFLGIQRPADCPLHVGLSRAKPDLADQHILDFDFFRSADHNRVRSALLHGWQADRPAAVGGDVRGCRGVTNRNADGLVRVIPSPEHDRRVSLQHHVVADDRAERGFRI